jgi:hypothetical protein
MTLCLGQSLVDLDGKYTFQDVAQKYVRWYEDGYMSAVGYCFDIGGATRVALEIWQRYFNQSPKPDPTDSRELVNVEPLIFSSLDNKVGSLNKRFPKAYNVAGLCWQWFSDACITYRPCFL